MAAQQRCSRFRLFAFLWTVQVALLALFVIFVEYDVLSQPHHTHTSDAAYSDVTKYYPMFQDVHVMMFVGFGFLMTFLKRYGYSSVGVNMLVAAFVLQWATLANGFFHMIDSDHNKITVNMVTLLTSDFCAAAILISMGALLGKVSPLQLIVMALFEVVFFALNEWIGLSRFHVADVGGSIFVHTFGAYFGIAAARVLYNKQALAAAESKEGSVYHSDLFAMIGTIFLWLFWPSFNSAVAADGDDRLRAIVHTYYSMAACAVVTFAVSSLVEKGKFDMVHVQNASLAGGVAVGAVADANIGVWGAVLIGMVAGALSVLGYKFVTPFLSGRLSLHDTCGVNNLHGMPGVLSAIASIVVAAMATPERYGDSLGIWSERLDGRTAGQQAGYQAAALVVTVCVAVVGGLITGFILRLPIFDAPKADQIHDDTDYWLLPDDGFPALPTPATADRGSREKMAPTNETDEATKV